jgi:ABC-type transport system involved in cytochrome bd biosynthesis fused ATPase/permease subunit
VRALTRHLLVPEVIQTSAMDCGPAALKSLFAGFGIHLSYDRLREACQTDVDGTSIDTLETLALALGLDVEQRVMPADLLLLNASACVPAIVVVRLPDGAPHFSVLWRAHGPWVQVMDPAGGRVWMGRHAFLESLYVHEQRVPAEAWKQWSEGPVFAATLAERLRRFRCTPTLWSDRAHQDASLRLARALVDARVLRRGAELQRFLSLCEAEPEQIPSQYWSARSIDSEADEFAIRGAVLVAAHGLNDTSVDSLPVALAAVRNELPPRVWQPVMDALREAGWGLPRLFALGLVVAAAGTVLEAFLFRGLTDLSQRLTSGGARTAAFALTIGYVAALLAIDWPIGSGLLRVGRQLELRLRARFAWKVPRAGDRYFRSRLISDMAFRAHSLHLLRQLPPLVGRLLQLCAALVLTASAIAWLYPGSGVPVALGVLAAVGVPLMFHPTVVEHDLRVREVSASLSRLYFDALRGSRAIKAHGAERTLRQAQAPQLVQWASTGLRQHALIVRAEALQLVLCFAAIVWLVFEQAGRGANPISAGLPLLIYWALSIGLLGQQVAAVVWNLPALRNTALRFLEPLAAGEEVAVQPVATSETRGVALEVDEVTVVAAGQIVLDRVAFRAQPGEHVAIVGASGAGKSSLVGLFLGWHSPASGCVRVDGEPLEPGRLAQIRQNIAWIDPLVHLFRATLFDNLAYGNGDPDVGSAIEPAGLLAALQRLPHGLQSSLGDAGSRVSGGEGQRVRVGRALARPGVRLAILDEAARGLERSERRRILGVLRTRFAPATLLAITHDISDTLDFDRVLVLDAGQIVEQGPPKLLRAQSTSRYRALLDAERRAEREWSHSQWRHVTMTAGRLQAAASQGKCDRGNGAGVAEEVRWTAD